MILSVDARNKVLDFFRVLYKNFNLEKKNFSTNTSRCKNEPNNQPVTVAEGLCIYIKYTIILLYYCNTIAENGRGRGSLKCGRGNPEPMQPYQKR